MHAETHPIIFTDMCPKASPINSIDKIWLRLRRPFRYPQAGHTCTWERYDADRAGCTLCGLLHKCSGSMVACDCPLAETDESGHVCLITGLRISEVRASCCEFVSHVSYEQPIQASSEGDGVHDKVLSAIQSFLNSPTTIACRKQEQQKSSLRVKQVFWRVLKQKKRDHPYSLPCLCSVVAEVAHAEQMQQFQGKSLLPKDSHELMNSLNRVVHTCSGNIAAAILQIHRLGFRKICQGGKFHSMVLGMLYMCRTGLHVGTLFQLPAVRDVHEFLPSETYLNSLGISNKVICDTENEIKSCIRAHVDGISGNIGANSSFIINGPKNGPSYSNKIDTKIGTNISMKLGLNLGSSICNISRAKSNSVSSRKLITKALTVPSFSSFVCS